MCSASEAVVCCVFGRRHSPFAALGRAQNRSNCVLLVIQWIGVGYLVVYVLLARPAQPTRGPPQRDTPAATLAQRQTRPCTALGARHRPGRQTRWPPRAGWHTAPEVEARHTHRGWVSEAASAVRTSRLPGAACGARVCVCVGAERATQRGASTQRAGRWLDWWRLGMRGRLYTRLGGCCCGGGNLWRRRQQRLWLLEQRLQRCEPLLRGEGEQQGVSADRTQTVCAQRPGRAWSSRAAAMRACHRSPRQRVEVCRDCSPKGRAHVFRDTSSLHRFSLIDCARITPPEAASH